MEKENQLEEILKNNDLQEGQEMLLKEVWEKSDQNFREQLADVNNESPWAVKELLGIYEKKKRAFEDNDQKAAKEIIQQEIELIEKINKE